MRTKIRAQERVTSDCHQTMDIEVEDSYGGHQRIHSLCPRKCSVVLTRVDTTSTGATSRAKTSGNNGKKRFACDWPGFVFFLLNEIMSRFLLQNKNIKTLTHIKCSFV